MTLFNRVKGILGGSTAFDGFIQYAAAPRIFRFNIARAKNLRGWNNGDMPRRCIIYKNEDHNGDPWNLWVGGRVLGERISGPSGARSYSK